MKMKSSATSKPRLKLRFEILLLLLVILSHACLLFLPADKLMKWYDTDDAFYYFQVARNIAQGNGITFDGINITSGFHPLWMLICIPVFSLAKINLLLPLRVLMIVSTLLTYLGGILLYRLVRRTYPAHGYLGVLIAVLWIFFWPLHQVITQSGLEAGLNGLLMTVLLSQISRLQRGTESSVRFMLTTGLLAALVLLCRLDNLFLVFFMGLWLIFREPRMRFLMIADTLSVFFSVYASFILRFGVTGSLPYSSSASLMVVLGILLLFICNLFFALYRPARLQGFLYQLLPAVISVSLTAAAMFGAMTLLTRYGWLHGFPRSVLLLFWGLMLLLSIGVRFYAGFFTDQTPLPALKAQALWQMWLRPGLAYFLPVVLLFGSYVIGHWLTFDTPLPISGQIKQWWGTLPNTIYGQPSANLWQAINLNFNLCPVSTISSPWTIAGATLLLPVNLILQLLFHFNFPPNCTNIAIPLNMAEFVLIGWLLWKRRDISFPAFEVFSMPVLLAVGVLQPFFYQANGYLHTRAWYWVDQALAAMLLSVIVVACLITTLENRGLPAHWGRWGVHVLSLVVFIFFVGKMFQVFSPFTPSAATFDPSIPFLERNTEAGARIGMTGGGVTAYFIKDRTIVNLDGLMNSTEYFDLMKQGRAQEYLDQIDLDYVFGKPDVLLHSDPYCWFFTDRLVEQQNSDTETLFIYVKHIE